MSWTALKRMTPCASAATKRLPVLQVAALAAQLGHEAGSFAVCAGAQGKRADRSPRRC